MVRKDTALASLAAHVGLSQLSKVGMSGLSDGGFLFACLGDKGREEKSREKCLSRWSNIESIFRT